MVSPQITPAKTPWRPPVGTVYVFDPSPLNWLFITWNTMEEPIRVDQDGRVVNALATDARWPDDHTLELDLRTGVRFQDGEPFTAHNVKQNFDEMQRWIAPHPPGSWLNFPPESVCEVVNDSTVRFHFPGPEGLALGKMRGFHIASSAFWRGQGFGYAKLGSGEGHW
ncbi:MAG: ABC transporter substrate-binding protein [Ktedonobacteraceae bacterium]|jgi:ABC-type transport system substrate-binding protein